MEEVVVRIVSFLQGIRFIESVMMRLLYNLLGGKSKVIFFGGIQNG